VKQTRSCISCRKKGEKGELIKLADTPAGVVVDYGEKLPGRGAYVCFEDVCIEGALKAGALSRAFKHTVKPPDAEEMRAMLISRVRAKVDALLGMARKSGTAVMGFEAVAAALKRAPGGLLVLAEDVAVNTMSKIEEAGGPGLRTVRYSTKDGLGVVLGVSPVGVVYLPRTGLAEALAREIGRLNKIGGG
jgi:predicted RNA-binding protein YlxR (DUF448 family)